jgi:hypothetical protein
LKRESVKPCGPTFQISVVSHDIRALSSVPKKEFLKPVLLSSLPISKRFLGENLAESRFLVGDDLLDGDFDFKGFVSARWDERFPQWPRLEKLDSLFENVITESEPKFFFAPITYRLSANQVKEWLDAQNLVHPGMREILTDLMGYQSLRVEEGVIHNLVMGNNFILPKDIAREFLLFWRTSFDYLVEKYGLDFPFNYRCPKCGLESIDGIDRWTRVRHAGFVMERVSALFFLSRPDLTSKILKKGKIVDVSRKVIYRWLGLGFHLSVAASRIAKLGRPCKDGHT